jgi:hypothetical protein
MVTGAEYRLELVRNGTSATVKVYNLDGTLRDTATNSAVGANPVTIVRIGNNASLTGTLGSQTYDELVITDTAAEIGPVAAPVTTTALTFPTVTLVSGATSTGSTAQVALADDDDLTYVEMSSGGIVDLILPRIVPPTGDLVVTLRDSSATASNLTVTLRDGTTTVATATASLAATGTAAGDRTWTFAAASISTVTAAKWDAGTLKVRGTLEGDVPNKPPSFAAFGVPI